MEGVALNGEEERYENEEIHHGQLVVSCPRRFHDGSVVRLVLASKLNFNSNLIAPFRSAPQEYAGTCTFSLTHLQ